MKRWLVLIIVLMLTGCGQNSAPNTTQPLLNVQSTPAMTRAAADGLVAPAPQVAMEMEADISEQSAQGDGEPQDMTFQDYGVNPFVDTSEDHLSTFAMDVDTASYTLTRNYLIGSNQFPPAEAIRPEEFINYFDAGYESPQDAPFGITMDAAPAPFGAENQTLLRVGIQGKYIDPADRTPALLIFVIDVSGSMATENRLGLVKESLALLVGELREDDRVGIAVYSDNSRVVLEPTPASERETIMNAINALQPEGSTNAEAGLLLGYGMADENKRDGQLTRIILCSDGVANVGNTGPDSILNNIREAVGRGINLSAIGFGMGNYNDVLMEQLANDGDGNYFYVDNLREARRVFVHNLTGTLQVIGYDAKIQVDFNPETVENYRLIGYENRAIADEDFRNDTVDAGEVGAGHSITALYEVELKDGAEGTMATAYIRYQDADTREVTEINREIKVSDIAASIDDTPASFRLAAAVAEFSEILRESKYAEGATFGGVRAMVEPLAGDDEQVTEFVELVRAAMRLSDG